MGTLKGYIHISGPAKFTFKEKGSEFTGLAFYAESEDEFHSILSGIKKEYYSATHHCYCARLVNGFLKYSDDGEPNGTAGLRILQAIEHYNLNNIIVIVVRYFGGTKLGTGPLGKAYFYAADGVLRSSNMIRKEAYKKLILNCRHAHVSLIHRIVNTTGAKILETNYNDDIRFTCAVPIDLTETFSQRVVEQSNAVIIVKDLNDIIFF